MQLSEEQIYNLAPDDSSKKSGKELAGAAKWVSKGISDVALWGECQGSGSKPYRTQVDIVNLAFKCSCPSRKFPCKHGLGLLLFHLGSPAEFPQSAMPEWVSEWIARRGEKVEQQKEKGEKPVDEAAQAKRALARRQKVSAGMDELLLWIKDIIRTGILNMPEKGAAYWETMARRMVDAQAPGLAAMVRQLGNLNFYRQGWQGRFVELLLKLYLVIKGYKNTPNLPELLQYDIESLVGFTQRQEELKAQPGIEDDWLVAGKQVTRDEQLTIERNWLYGTNSKRFALILQFLVRGQTTEIILTPGTTIHAELVFFKSAVPLRAIIKQQQQVKKVFSIRGCNNWNEVVQQETIINAVNPFIDEHPFIIQQLRLVSHNNGWWLQDNEQKMMRLKTEFPNLWQLLSLSGGKPLPMVVIGKENEYMPMGAWHLNEYKTL